MKKSKLILLILLVAVIVLVAVYFAVVRPLVNRKQITTNEPVPLLDGESYFHLNGNYSNQIPVMFEQVDRADLYEIRILGEDGTYGFTHYLSNGKDYFLMWTEDGEGERTLYMPELAKMSADFDYTTLYDETSKIPSLITGSGCVVFKDRVYIRADADPAPTDEEYQTILHRYGLADADHPVGYEIKELMRDDRGNLMYYDADGNLYCTDGNKESPRYYDAITLRDAGYDYDGTPVANVSGKTLSVLPSSGVIRVFVGDLLPDESGYYLRIEGRDVIYTTGTSTIGQIVYQPLSYYIHPRLVQAGEFDGAALYTTSFRVFTGTGARNTGIAGSDTVLFTSSYAVRNGLDTDRTGALSLGTGDQPADLVEALVSSGASVGDTIPLLVGSTVEPHRALRPDKKTAYAIFAVGAVIRGDEYLDQDGTAVQAGDTVICAYTADGTAAAGMIDLSTAPAALADAIVGLTVGAGDGRTPLSSALVDFTDAPTFETAVYQVELIQAFARNEDFTIGLVVWDSSDKLTKQTAAIPKTGSRGYVAISYSVKRDGVLAVERTLLCLDGGNQTLAENMMAAAILASDYASGSLTLGYRSGIRASVALPADPFTSYVVYRDFKVTGIYGNEEEIGVAYVNDTERNIFYGGSAYEIRTPASRTVYSVNNSNLMNVLQSIFNEAKGTRTVAVGLTDENFERYGLGAHAVYIEMPSGVAYRDGTTMDIGITSRLGFRLYISDRKSDASGAYYYVASDLYGTVVRANVSDCDLSFVDWDFGKSWVDDDLLLLDLTDIRDITFRINYSDLKETHGFAISVNPTYHSSMDDADVSDRIYVAYVPGAAPLYQNRIVERRLVEPDNRNYATRNASGSAYYRTDYGVQISEVNNDFWSVRIVSNEGAIGLDDHYSNVRGGAELEYTGSYFEGVANFTKLITMIYTSKYSGSVTAASLSDAELARVGDLLQKDGEGKYVLSDDDALDRAVFSIRLTLIDGRVFRLTFYPYSDGRYLLSFEDTAAGIVSREFFLHMGEIKNMVTAVRTIVAGGSVRYDESYLPEPN